MKYDPADYWVPPALNKGTSERLQFYIQSGHMRALATVARSGKFIWTMPNDVARWCIKFGMEHVDRIDKEIGISSVVQQANAAIDDLQEDARKRQFTEFIDKAQQTVMGYRNMGEIELAKETVKTLKKRIDAMPDTGQTEVELRWKLKYLDKFDLMFRDLYYEQ